MFGVFKSSERPSLPFPVKKDELKYQALRKWFINHEEKASLLWREFWGNIDWTILLDDDVEIAETLDNINLIIRNGSTNEFIEEFSSYFYDPENLYEVIFRFVFQGRPDKWPPDKEQIWKKMTQLLKMSNIIVTFVKWIDGKI